MRQAPKELEIDQASVLLGDLALFERDQSRNAANAEARRNRRLLVDIDLGEAGARFKLLRRLVQDRRHRAARPAPGRPEVDNRGMSLRSTCLSKVFEVSVIGSPVNRFALQAPHLASEAGRSAGTRLTTEQRGQTAWMDSLMGARPLSMALANIWPQSAPFQALERRRPCVRSRIRDHTLP